MTAFASQYVGAVAGPQGGWTPYRNLSLLNVGVVVKAAGGQVGGAVLVNNAAALRYVKLYDLATAPDQTSTPALMLALLANSVLVLPPGATGVQFATGISLRATTGLADNDNGAPAANDVVVNLFYA